MQSAVQTIYYSADLLAKKPHFHDCHQLILIVKGEVNFLVNGICYHAGEGDVALFSRYENHSVHVLSGEYERYVLQLEPSIANRTSPVYSLLTHRPAGFSNVIRVLPYREDLIGIFRHLLLEHERKEIFSDEMEQLLVKQLLIGVFRCTSVAFDSLSDEVVLSLKRKFENKFREHYSLAGLARQYSISPSSLSHRFRQATGTSVMEYLQACRIAQAKRMLAETDESIGAIVEECGFSDSSNFSRTFKQKNGISPSAFRKKYKAE